MNERLERRLLKLEAAQGGKTEAPKIDTSRLSYDLLMRLFTGPDDLSGLSEADLAELEAAGFDMGGDMP